MPLRVTGLNHRRAPVELREKLSVPPERMAAELAAVRTELGAAEAVLLSTCNRVELYHVHDEGTPDATAFLAKQHGLAAQELAPVLYVHDGYEAARHLFEVTSGFDSMVPGETQILGQTRDAYKTAHDGGHTGRVLNKLFQAAVTIAKKVHSETALAERSVSMPSVATRLASKIFADLGAKTLLVVGAGETGRLAVEAFRERGVKRVIVVNRTIEKAQALTGEAHGLDELPSVLSRADLLISCITHDGYAITPEIVRAALKARRREPMFLLDLGVPRNIHPDVNRLDNVYLFDVDDVQEIVRQNLADREKTIATVRPIVDRAAQAAMQEIEALDVHRVLTRLREICHKIGEEEIGKIGDPERRKEAAYLVERVINRILHTPTTALKAEAKNGETFALVELAIKLFGLNSTPKG